MAKFRISPESGFIQSLFQASKESKADLEVDLEKTGDPGMWNLGPRDESLVSDYRKGPWGFVADTQMASDNRIKRSEIMVLPPGEYRQSYLVIDFIFDKKTGFVPGSGGH